LPEVALLLLHAPEALHEVASVELQVSVALLPDATTVGFVVRITVGGCDSGGGVVTGKIATLAELLVVPPVPVHERVNVLF
jgi:hypothetical protein